jgi:ankyrin repeat protein
MPLLYSLETQASPSYTKMSISDLFDACKRGDIARVREAVADGVNVRKVVDKNVYNETPLHCACR